MAALIFDFDGTLCPGDSILPFLSFCIQEKLAKPHQYLLAARGFLLQKAGRITPSDAKAVTLSFLAGRSLTELEPYARRFVHDTLRPRIYPEAGKMLDKLHAEGYHIMVVSASTDVYMRFLPEILPVDTVLSTVCEVQEGCFYTGRILSNCRGEEKVRRITAWLRDHTQTAWPPMYAFGDSRYDIDMLRLSPNPTLIHPDRHLRAAFPDAPVLSWGKGR